MNEDRRVLTEMVGGLSTTHIYLMSDGHGYKIGQAGDPEARLDGLKTGNPRIQLLKTWLVQIAGAERMLHSFYEIRARKIDREWFALADIDMQWLLTLDDPSMHSWLANGLFSYISGDAEAMRHGRMYIPYQGEEPEDLQMVQLFAYWTVPERDVLIQSAFLEPNMSRRQLADRWRLNTREVLLTSVIRTPITIHGETFLGAVRALGNWRTSGNLEMAIGQMIRSSECPEGVKAAEKDQ